MPKPSVLKSIATKSIVVRRYDWRPAIRPLERDEAVAAIGDVHGHDDLFATLLDAVAEDLAGAGRATLVQLGDLIDRGPAGVAALRRAKAGLPGVVSVALKGNHEDVLARVLADEDPALYANWLDYGGDEMAAEVGVSAGSDGWRAAFRAALGDELVAWIEALPAMHRVGDLVFVHAGLDPEAQLARQPAHTLMWTRRPWLDSPGPYAEKVAVVHGHTPQRTVDFGHKHRINLDTGAYRSGVLSGLVVAGDRMRLVQAMR